MFKYHSYPKTRSGIENIKKQRKKYPDIALEVINISDIILEVIDARFIEDTRNREMENLIKSKGKKIIYVINKIDLAEMKKVREVIEAEKLYPYILISCKNRRGSKMLRDKIKIEASRVENDYSRKQVGIIGYPNTGKSSLINLLVGRPSTKTSSEAGYTKNMQKVKLTTGVLLLDTPGVIPSKENSNISATDLAKHAKIGVRTYDKVKDPEFVVFDLMKKFPGAFEKYYAIEAAGDVEILIEQLGRKRNFLKKGGEIDDDRTARSILKDWQENRIKTD